MLKEIEKSPQLPAIVDQLRNRLKAETELRHQFYQDMTPEEKVEFIEGEVILHSRARNRHLEVTMNMASLLKPFVEVNELGEVRVEKCLVVFPRNDYEPDIVFFCPEKAMDLTPETMKFPIPDFVVEVLSESTESRDRGVKFEDFESHGVSEYWIVDSEEETIEQYVLKSGKFELALKSGTGLIESHVIAGFNVAIEAFFDRKANLSALKGILSAS